MCLKGMNRLEMTTRENTGMVAMMNAVAMRHGRLMLGRMT